MNEPKEITSLFRSLSTNSRIKYSVGFDTPLEGQDWRRYIPQIVKECWKRMTTESKHIAFIFAEMQARTEIYRAPKVKERTRPKKTKKKRISPNF